MIYPQIGRRWETILETEKFYFILYMKLDCATVMVHSRPKIMNPNRKLHKCSNRSAHHFCRRQNQENNRSELILEAYSRLEMK